MIVSEAYLRIGPTLDARRKRVLGEAIFSVTEDGAREFFRTYETPRVAEVVIEDGSTKFRARIRTSAIVLVTMVGGYGSVRSGLDYIWHDGRAAASWMASHIIPLLPDPPDVRRSRAPAATRLRRLFDSVEAGELSVEDASKRAEDILKEYGEKPDTVRTVIDALRQEFQAIEPSRVVRKQRQRDFPAPQRPTPLRAGKRMSVFRDPRTGRLVFSET